MKWKLKEAIYNQNDGYSCVTITTDLGEFSGYCKLHDEDKDIASNFFGCKIAEMRATVKYGKAKIKKLKNKIDIIKNLIDNLEKINNYNKNSAEARYIRKQYYILTESLNQWTKNLTKLNEQIYNEMKNYRKNHENFYKKIEEKKQKSIE